MRRPALALLALAACAHAATDVKFGKTAEEDYRSGEEELKAHNFAEAVKFFEHTRNKYPFSKYAALSELRLADTKFEQERFVESADAYAQFAKLHPTHESADYAAYRVGLSRWRDGPSSFPLFPPAHEKDLAQVREAVKALADFVQKYPGSKYRPEAQRILDQARDELAEHEWYVAGFYAKRERWPAVVGRLDTLLKEHPGSRHEPEALMQLAQAYLALHESYRAQQALQQLIVKHPQDPRRPEAEKLLASLR